MDSKLKGKQQPRLGRLNANKNIDYDPLPSTSSSPPPPSNPILFGNQTSFRIEGIDGEIDRICFTLGLSGPDDFSIPFDAWLAKKPKSTRIQQQEEEIELSPIQEEEEIPNSEVNDTTFVLLVSPTPIDRAISEEEDINGSGGVGEEAELFRRIDASNGEQVEEVQICKSDRGGWGINGVRPPLLVPPSALENEVEDSPSSMLTSSASSDKVDGMEIGLGETTLSSEPSPSASTSSDSDHNDDEEGEGDGNDDDQDGGGGVDSTTNANHMYIISPNVSFKREIKSWTKGALLGSGSFGTVYEGFSNDGFFFAVKEVSLLDQGNQAKQSIYQLEQEISLLSQFEHENIVQYLGTDKDEEKLYIFLELVPKGSLAQLYHKYDLQDSQVSAYTRQILHGLKYLHDRNVVHRDIKCANILVDVQGYVKLADFGLAKATKLNDVKSCKGTAFWMAPEVVNRKSRGYGLAADIWSLGCTVLEMLTRQLPYSHLECMQALFRIGRGEPPPVSNSLSATARDFIHQCLRVKADDRPTAALLLEHPFVNRLQSASSGSGSPSQPNWRRS